MTCPPPTTGDINVSLRLPSRPAALRITSGAQGDLLSLGLLLGLALLLLVRQIVLGGTFYNDDIVLQSIPVYSWYAEGLKQGHIPIWSPSILGGFPLAFGQYSFFYPPDMLLFFLLDAARAFHLSLALHLFLAGACTYWYCRVLGLRRLPSLFAAVAFQMGNEVLSWPANGFITRTLFALPALLATIELTFHRSTRYWLLVPPIVGAALLGGYAQIVLFALVVAAPYALVTAIARGQALGPRKSGWLLSLLALGVVLGFGLAAVRVMPTLLVTAMSPRASGIGFDRSAVDSIEPWALMAGYLLPSILEIPGTFAARPDYVGAPALLLAALTLGYPSRLGRPALFHAAVAAISTLLSLGKYTPIYGLLLHLPFFDYFRGPNRFSLVAAMAIAVLAAYGLDRGLALDLGARRKSRRLMASMAGLFVLVAIVATVASLSFQFGRDPVSEGWRSVVEARGLDVLNALRPRVALSLLGLAASPLVIIACARGRLSNRALGWSALLLTTITLFALGWIQNPWLPPQELNDPPALLQELRDDTERFRLFSYAPAMSVYNVGVFYKDKVGYLPSVEFDERYRSQFIPPNLNMLFGVDTANGYEILQSRRQALVGFYMGSDRTDYARYSDGDWVDWNLHNASLHDRLNLLAALNVGYLMHAFPIEDPRLEPMGEVSERIYPNLPAVAKVYLFRLKTALPRALVVPGTVTMSGEKQVLDALVAGSQDLRQVAILEEQPPVLGGPALTVAGSSVEIVDYQEDRVTLRAHSDGTGFLVLMDFLLPGWSATVDGQWEPILAANFAGRAVPLRGAGEHQIVFSYEAPLLRQGLMVSLGSLALVILIPLAWKFRIPRSVARRREAPSV